MKVLFINSVCGIRSTGRIVANLADRCMAEGCECRIAYGRGAAHPQYERISYRIGANLSVGMNVLKARLLDNEAFNARKETERFLEWADSYDPDMLWLHNLHGYYINIELLFDWIKKRPQMTVRWTLHDCWAFTGHCSHFEYVNCGKWESACFACDQRKEYPKSLFLDNSRRNYQKKKSVFCGVRNLTLITPSIWLANLVERSFLKEYPVELARNKIDETVFKPTPSRFREKHGLQGKTLVLGVASSWGKRKGLGDFVKLADMLDDGCKLVMVGLTEKQMREMPRSILCIGRTNSESDLAKIYTAADVFVNLTYEDTYPTVNLEAIACGTPCITYRTGGSVESVDADYVVEKGDLTAVVEKIRAIEGKGNR